MKPVTFFVFLFALCVVPHFTAPSVRNPNSRAPAPVSAPPVVVTNPVVSTPIAAAPAPAQPSSAGYGPAASPAATPLASAPKTKEECKKDTPAYLSVNGKQDKPAQKGPSASPASSPGNVNTVDDNAVVVESIDSKAGQIAESKLGEAGVSTTPLTTQDISAVKKESQFASVDSLENNALRLSAMLTVVAVVPAFFL